MHPHKAFVLAAGFGKRLRPYTDTIPKPLVKIGNQTLLNRTLDQLVDAGVRGAVINTHYLSDQIESATQNRQKPVIQISREEKLLDTGGGIKQALPYFMNEVFYVLAGDGFWSDGPQGSALLRLAENWNMQEMDILMLLFPVASMTLTQGVGDYDIDQEGRATRSKNKTGHYMFTSIRINHPRIFENTPEGPFSYLELMDRAEKNGRLFAIIHDGLWHHISTPSDLEAVEKSLPATHNHDD